LPSFQDPEGCTVTISYEPNSLSSFVSVVGQSLVFQPKQLYQVGDFDISVVLTDPLGLQVKAPFKFTVYEPSRFVGAVVKQIELMASNQAYYSLPVV
jgi:hypothetical protein